MKCLARLKRTHCGSGERFPAHMYFMTVLRPDDGTFFAKHKDLCAHRVSMVLFICRSSNDISRVTERDCLEFSGSVG